MVRIEVGKAHLPTRGRERRIFMAKIYEKARQLAFRDLKELHEGEYEVLYQGYLAELKAEIGFENRMADANREKAEAGLNLPLTDPRRSPTRTVDWVGSAPCTEEAL